MRKLIVSLGAVLCAAVGWGGVASADNYNDRRPRVAVESSVVTVGDNIVASAKYFCPGQPLTFTLTGPGGTFTSPNVFPALPAGTATYSFSTVGLEAGKYTITAQQRPTNGPGDCWRTATTKVKIKKNGCDRTLVKSLGSSECDDDDDDDDDDEYSSSSIGPGSVASGSDPDVASNGVAAGEFLTSYQSNGITPQVLSAGLAAAPSAARGAILPVTGSNSAPVTQIAAVAAAAGLAMMLVAGFRRRSNASVRPLP